VFVPFRWMAWILVRITCRTMAMREKNIDRERPFIGRRLAPLSLPPVRPVSGDNEGFCMESSYSRAPHLESASSIVLRGKWRADFRRDRDDLILLFEIIQRMN